MIFETTQCQKWAQSLVRLALDSVIQFFILSCNHNGAENTPGMVSRLRDAGYIVVPGTGHWLGNLEQSAMVIPTNNGVFTYHQELFIRRVANDCHQDTIIFSDDKLTVVESLRTPKRVFLGALTVLAEGEVPNVPNYTQIADLSFFWEDEENTKALHSAKKAETSKAFELADTKPLTPFELALQGNSRRVEDPRRYEL